MNDKELILNTVPDLRLLVLTAETERGVTEVDFGPVIAWERRKRIFHPVTQHPAPGPSDFSSTNFVRSRHYVVDAQGRVMTAEGAVDFETVKEQFLAESAEMAAKHGLEV